MTLQELKDKIQEYQYFEDTDIIEVALASVIATRLKIGDPIWMILIGASSGGKSQILRPLALTDSEFMQRIDDLTENTLLSGGKVAGGGDPSLLSKIGPHGMMVISDMTVIFSKSEESRAALLSQFRMLYDGEMTKYVGNSAKPIQWKGYLGILAGSTPSIYSSFEEVSDMGERFIYYRMKPYDPHKATNLALNRKIFGKQLDEKLSELYVEYLKGVVQKSAESIIELPEFVQKRIIEVSILAESIRTTVHTDSYDKQITRIPVVAMPMRVAIQLTALAKGIYLMRKNDGLEFTTEDMRMIDWCGYSLANEEKRACLKILSILPFMGVISTQTVADRIGLSTSVVGMILQNLASTGVVTRSGLDNGLSWRIDKENDYNLIREIQGIDKEEIVQEREITSEELDTLEIDLLKDF